MHAITIAEPGGPEALVWTEVPDPEPAAGEVLLDVVASAVNRADVLQRQGHYALPPGAPPYPGLECSGRILALGEGVTDWAVGDEVCALLIGGGYAERIAVPAGQLLPVPKGVTLTQAAALPEVCCTVWSNVFADARLSPGETFLVHGGAGGVGTAAIQIATAYGARVLCTARAAMRDRCFALGAERVIDYQDEDFVAVVKEVTDGRGADVVLDIMGASYLERNVAALATGGRLAVIGLQGGRKGQLDLAALAAKQARILASLLRPRPEAEKAWIIEDVRDHVWPLIEAGRVTPVIDRAVAMVDAAEGHRAMEEGGLFGKVILVR